MESGVLCYAPLLDAVRAVQEEVGAQGLQRLRSKQLVSCQQMS
jgi:hypothetical protein